MCRICSEDHEEQRQARNELSYFADELEDLAAKLRNMASGYIKPHSEKSKVIQTFARSIIKELVKWI